jgi:outer membrane lipopolysaccharide assembly protein LptE/RlpB
MKLAASISCLLLAAAAVGCAGYQVGQQTLFRSDVRTVYVPVFESDSFRRFLGERLTEAVVKEIEQRTPYKVTTSDRADTVLQGRIVYERKSVKIYTVDADPRNLEYQMVVDVNWTDRLGRAMTQPPTIRITYDANFIPESGQSLTTAQQELIERIAQQIVNQMEAAW